MAKRIFNGHSDNEKYSKDEAIGIVNSKVEKYVGNKSGVSSLHLFDTKTGWICTTDQSKSSVEDEDGSTEVHSVKIEVKA